MSGRQEPFVGLPSPALYPEPYVQIHGTRGASAQVADGVTAYVHDPAHARRIAAAFTRLADQLELAQAQGARGGGDPS